MNKKISTPLAILIIVVLSVILGGSLLGYMYYSSKQISEIPQIEIKSGLNLEKIKNAEYFAGLDEKEKVKLVDGSYFKQYPNSASGLSVEIYDNKVAFGDLNQDGKADAAVILSTNGGGSGSFRSLVVMLDDNGNPSYLTGIALGDRVAINSINIESGIITLDMVVHASGDGLCCPSLKEVRKYKLSNNQLEEYKGDETADWKTYKNEEYGFEFQYPANLFNKFFGPVSESCDNTYGDKKYSSRYIFEADQDNPPNPTNMSMSMTVICTKLEKDKIDSFIKDIGINREGPEVIQTQLGGRIAYQTYAISTATRVTKSFHTFVDLGNNTLQISFYFPRLDMINQIFSTFKFTDNITGENLPVIDSITPNSGPVGSTIEIKGRNFNGFEGDLIAWIENSKGEKGILYSIDHPGVATLIRTKIESKLCTTDNSYSGLPCSKYLDIVPGVYKIYTYPWGNKSNEVQFTVTP